MIISLDLFIKLLDSERSKTGAILALTSMPGDPIHPGHISCLQSIKDRCINQMISGKIDKFPLITACLVNDDNFLINKKGYAFIPLEDRCTIIDNIKYGVDYIIPYSPSDSNDSTVCEAIKLLKPTYFCKGGDRLADETLPEWNICKQVGCKIIDMVGADKKWSSSDYVRNLLNKINL